MVNGTNGRLARLKYCHSTLVSELERDCGEHATAKGLWDDMQVAMRALPLLRSGSRPSKAQVLDGSQALDAHHRCIYSIICARHIFRLLSNAALLHTRRDLLLGLSNTFKPLLFHLPADDRGHCFLTLNDRLDDFEDLVAIKRWHG